MAWQMVRVKIYVPHGDDEQYALEHCFPVETAAVEFEKALTKFIDRVPPGALDARTGPVGPQKPRMPGLIVA